MVCLMYRCVDEAAVAMTVKDYRYALTYQPKESFL